MIMMKRLFSSVSIVILAFSAGAVSQVQEADAQISRPVIETAPVIEQSPQEEFEETTLEHPDDIVTEAQFAADYINYMAPPDAITGLK